MSETKNTSPFATLIAEDKNANFSSIFSDDTAVNTEAIGELIAEPAKTESNNQ